MMERYERIEKIGEGRYGQMFKARDKENSENIVALKRTRLEVKIRGHAFDLPITGPA